VIERINTYCTYTRDDRLRNCRRDRRADRLRRRSTRVYVYSTWM